MASGIQFDENQNFDPIPEPVLQPPTFADGLLKSGVISKPGDAIALLAVFALILISASFYILISSVPQPPTLGSDMLRPGEQVPSYVK
jgi:hypothetical protein